MDKKRISLIGVTIILGVEFLIRNVFFPTQANEFHIRIAIFIEWVLLAFVLVIWIPKIEKESLASVGFGKFRWRYFWLGLLVYILVTIALIFSGMVLEANGLKPIRSLQAGLKTLSISTLIGLFLTGTILEEILYRGYLIERLSELLGHRWLAGFVSWAAFTLVHLKFFGLGPTIDVSIISAALVAIYIREDSIWPCIVVHGINNALSYLLFPMLVG
jgi:membrane protease YdiL (CAAX protease family)